MKINLNRFAYKTEKFIRKNSANILTAASVIGTVALGISSVKSTTKALRAIEEKEVEKGGDISSAEAAKIVVPLYAPPIILCISTVACIIGSNSINKQYQASLMTACVLANNSFNDYKNKVIELYGDKTDSNIKNEIAKDRFNNDDAEWRLGSDEVLFYDEYSDTFFTSTMEKVHNAEYSLNRNFALRGYCDLNEFYKFLGIPETDEGEILGWSFDVGVGYYGYSWIDFYHELVTNDDGTTFYRIGMPFGPTSDFMSEW